MTPPYAPPGEEWRTVDLEALRGRSTCCPGRLASRNVGVRTRTIGTFRDEAAFEIACGSS
jgi:hypothetical protein